MLFDEFLYITSIFYRSEGKASVRGFICSLIAWLVLNFNKHNWLVGRMFIF